LSLTERKREHPAPCFPEFGFRSLRVAPSHRRAGAGRVRRRHARQRPRRRIIGSSTLRIFAGRVIRLRLEHPVFRRRKFFKGRRLYGSDIKDIAWLKTDGAEMTEEDWNKGFVRTLGMLLNGEAMDEYDEHGERITDDTFLVLFNAWDEAIDFTLPDQGARWKVLLRTDTLDPPEQATIEAGGACPVDHHGLALLLLES
jgi:glycogen operon protein